MAVLTQTPEALFPEINLKKTFNTSTVSTMFETSQYNKFEKCYSLKDLKRKKNKKTCNFADISTEKLILSSLIWKYKSTLA